MKWDSCGQVKTKTMLLGCFAGVLFGGLAGCASSGESLFKPHKEGYEVVTISRHRDLMHEYHRGEIYYWDKQGKKALIWRYRSNQFLHTNDLALFHGYLTTGPDDPGGATRRGVERLFAVHGPGPVVDITDDVVRLWANASGTNFSDVMRSRLQRVGEMEKIGERFVIKVGVIGGGHGTVELTPNQIIGLIQDAKAKGVPMKDPGFGTPYLKRDWEAELRKP